MRNNKIFYGIALIFLAVVVLFIGQLSAKRFFRSSKYSNDEIIKKDSRTLPGLHSIASSCNGEVEIIVANEERVEYFYDDEEYENKSTFENGLLTIDFNSIRTLFFGWNNSSEGVRVKVYTKSLKSISQDGIGSISSAHILNSDELNISNNGIGSLTLNVNSNNVEASNDGVGSIELEGRANTLKLNNSGTGSIDAINLLAKYAKVINDGVGSIEVNASDSIDLRNSGVGSITHTGEARILRSVSDGVGSIDKQ